MVGEGLALDLAHQRDVGAAQAFAVEAINQETINQKGGRLIAYASSRGILRQYSSWMHCPGARIRDDARGARYRPHQARQAVLTPAVAPEIRRARPEP